MPERRPRADRAQHAARVADRDAVRRDVLRHDAARADHAVVADRHARADDDVRAEPAVIADHNRLGVAGVQLPAVLGFQGAALVRQQWVLRRHDRHIRPEVAVFADRDRRVVLNRQVEVAEKVRPDARVHAVVDLDRPLNARALAEFAEDLRQDLRALLVFVLKRAVVLRAQVVAAQLDRHEVRVPGAEELARKYFFFFSHLASSSLSFKCAAKAVKDFLR